MNLAIDIGNSFTKFGLFKGHKIIYYFKVPTPHIVNSLRLFKKISTRYSGEIQNIGISSVVPKADYMLKNPCIAYFNIKPVFISNKIKLPVKIKTKIPSKTGADRICNSAAAYEYFKHKENIIVIGMGTATTYDIILKNGDFTGGLISPGIEISAKALHDNTGKLPLIGGKKLILPKNIIGKNSEEAVQSGIMFSALYAVEGIVKHIEKQYRRKFKVIITGGLSKTIRSKISFKANFIDNLALKGINEILIHNSN